MLKFINFQKQIFNFTVSSFLLKVDVENNRSYKTFDIENFNDDIEQIKINQTCHEVDYVYNEYEKDFINVLNKHAPIKSRYQRKLEAQPTEPVSLT